MANRYPLVVDTTNGNKIREIPNGDNLQLTGNSVIGVVDVTASGTVSANEINATSIKKGGTELATVAVTGAFSDITGGPTQLSDLTDDLNVLVPGDNVGTLTNNVGYLTTVAFADLTATPTTLAGYGITDAATTAQGGLAATAVQPGASVSVLVNDAGYLTLADIQNGAVTIDVNNTGDLVGSVFADDSTILIDSILAAVNLDGTIRGHVRPNANQHNLWDLGTDAVRFKNAYFAGTINGAHVGTLDGDVEGSVFGDDSTLLVDGNNNKIVGVVDTTSIRTSEDKIALGENTGVTNQAYGGIAIGPYAGTTDQDSQAVAVGTSAGRERQGSQATALGRYAGQNDQGVSAVAIGHSAGRETQGTVAIAIGKLAGETNQAANSIVINATGSAVENTTASSTVIQPVRNQASANVMMYNPANGELTHTATPGTLAANIDQATLAIGATTATSIGIGNAGSTTTINGTVAMPAVVSGSITADDSMSITTATGDGNAISIGPAGTNRVINLTADSIRFFGPVTSGITGDITGSVFGDDSTVLVDGNNNKVVGDVESTNIHGAAFKADTIVNNTGTTLDITAAGFLNIFGGADDAGVSNIQMDKNGINHIELTTEPGNPSDAADVANIAINATAASGNVIIGASTSSRGQVVEIYQATVTGTLVGSAQGAHTGTLAGDLSGSVFGEDSAMLIDGTSSKIVGPVSRIVGDVQQISGPGAISLDTLVTEITTTGVDDPFTLADGVIGQVKVIAMIDNSGGLAILTPTTLATGTTITFTNANDNITLLYTTNGWLNTANQNATIA